MSEQTPPQSGNRLITASRVTDFLVDGDLDKPVWQRAHTQGFTTSYDPALTYPEAYTEVAAVWDPESVYFAFRSSYLELNLFQASDPSRQTWELWNRDVVEVFVTPYPERPRLYWEFQVAPNNLWIDLEICREGTPDHNAEWASGFTHQTRIEPEVWHCEMKIPVRCFGLPKIEAGMQWRVNFYRCDGPGDDSERRFLAWSPTHQKNFHVPERFGTLRFESG